MNKCIGCGIVLQNDDPMKEGYFKKMVLFVKDVFE